jgi:hypothetical protein
LELAEEFGVEGDSWGRVTLMAAGVSMTVRLSDPIMGIAERVTYCFSESGYAFIEDDQVEALADALTSQAGTAAIGADCICWPLSTRATGIAETGDGPGPILGPMTSPN